MPQTPTPPPPASPAPASAAKKPLPWRVPKAAPGVAATPSCNPNYRPPAPGK